MQSLLGPPEDIRLGVEKRLESRDESTPEMRAARQGVLASRDRAVEGRPNVEGGMGKKEEVKGNIES